MPIPAFDHNYVLPPHLGNPTTPSELSPYECTSLEFCQRFSTSPERREILSNFLRFRGLLRANGLIQAIQWLDGSFLEDIESQKQRAPRDLDLVTIFWEYDDQFQDTLFKQFPEFGNSQLSKQNFKLDHYPFDAGFDPLLTVDLSRYWAQLFSHNRDGVWKGMLSIPLDTPDDDARAVEYLQNLTK
jgi:hypothetical protein